MTPDAVDGYSVNSARMSGAWSKADSLCSKRVIPSLLWFLDAGDKRAPHAQLTGVQKAPRHEVAGSWAPAKQRALWGFNACAELDGRRDADGVRPACL